MKPILACGHTEYDRGHCGVVGCANDFCACPDCCPPGQARSQAPSWARKPRNHQET